ncbi:hypothetical protein GGR54DRAFT_600825 [Hypoxylon sp. NC1633]|nr:hypothetical protein GGR54DRAFT_600825 [Hypoxylon sp. NC1633]
MFTPVESRVNSNDARGNDRGGNQLYSAPERSQRDGHNTINTINNKADMFAFGAVLSDTCAWVKGGPTEKAKYLQQRKNYHQNVETQCGRDYEGCFHDGVERLPIVDDMHEVIRNHCQLANDKITPRVIEMIEQYMLLPNPNSRYGAGELSKRFNEILRPNSDTTLVADPQPVRESRDQSLADLGKRIAKRESASGPEAKRFRNSVDADIERLSKDLNINVPHRHHLFYIDDSTSMSKHAKSVEEAFLALLHLTRRLEGHKVELCFASDSKKIHQKRRAKGLAQLVARQEYLRQPDMMEQCFVQLVHNVIIPRLPSHIFGMKVNLFAKTKKPTSIYVFTDGNWGRQGGPADGACGVEGPIQQLSRELLKRNLDKNYVSFHFVRFGDDPDGRRHLTYLDRVGWGTNR